MKHGNNNFWSKCKDVLGKVGVCAIIDIIIAGLVLAAIAIEVAVTREVPMNVRHLWYGDSLTHYFRFTHICYTIGGCIFMLLGDIVVCTTCDF